MPVVTEAATSEKKPSARDLKRQKRKEARENADTDSSMAVVAEEKPAEREAAEPKRMVNSDCAKIMEVNDFRKLMRKMSGQKKSTICSTCSAKAYVVFV
ncbi:hypothetical protein MKQ70_33055 [Chitinophaga sedimenti]|uniref:hypothetical protein n=1 Tax=Chitinophaga sedimenti TaxID=2033606 RepID=UPI002003FA3A|nr:hypothetical protein [Chitinophaga sedimenti]MCK7559538.1 hypothetical protein [Chitinophaga sedimenti]